MTPRSGSGKSGSPRGGDVTTSTGLRMKLTAHATKNPEGFFSDNLQDLHNFLDYMDLAKDVSKIYGIEFLEAMEALEAFLGSERHYAHEQFLLWSQSGGEGDHQQAENVLEFPGSELPRGPVSP